MIDLPVDLVPNTKLPCFRWKQVAATPLGQRLVVRQMSVSPALEGALADLIRVARQLEAERDELRAERDKLQAFKDWVHAYLDALNAPKEFPDGRHTKEGCRIGDRMDWLVNQISIASEAAPRVEVATAPTGKVRRK